MKLLCFHPYLFVCWQDYSKCYEVILTKPSDFDKEFRQSMYTQTHCVFPHSCQIFVTVQTPHVLSKAK